MRERKLDRVAFAATAPISEKEENLRNYVRLVQNMSDEELRLRCMALPPDQGCPPADGSTPATAAAG